MRTKKTKKSVKFIASVLICAFACIEVHGQDAWNKERTAAKEAIDSERMYRGVSFLSDSLCQGRATGTRGNIEASFWISRIFKEAGLLSFSAGYVKPFHVRPGVVGHNVIGMLPGSYTEPRDKYIIVGAHFDHIGILNGKMYPGADSNASGVTAMTSLAEMFSKMKENGKVYDCNIIFVAFDAKEMDLAGSEALWDMINEGRLTDPLSGRTITRSKISLMVNIDQIGSVISPVNKGVEEYMIMLGSQSLRYDRRGILEKCNTDEGFGMDICLSYYGSRNFTKVFYTLSDQRVFVKNSIPAVLFTSGITMNTNKTWDNADGVDFDVLHKRTCLIFHWLEKMM